jgi:hypothetical protein
MINTESSCLQLVAKQQRKIQGGGCLKRSPVGGEEVDVTGEKRSRSWSGIVEKEMKVRGEVTAVHNKAPRREDVCVAAEVWPCMVLY